MIEKLSIDNFSYTLYAAYIGWRFSVLGKIFINFTNIK